MEGCLYCRLLCLASNQIRRDLAIRPNRHIITNPSIIYTLIHEGEEKVFTNQKKTTKAKADEATQNHTQLSHEEDLLNQKTIGEISLSNN